MNKQEFLAALARELEPLPREERYQTLNYYDELIDDRLEDGQEEEAVIQSLGDPKAVAQELLAGEDELLVPNRGLRVWLIVLLVLGFPLWGSLLVTAAVVLLCVFICLYIPSLPWGCWPSAFWPGRCWGRWARPSSSPIQGWLPGCSSWAWRSGCWAWRRCAPWAFGTRARPR